MADGAGGAADGTAVRVALWRAMHALVDPAPHVLVDEIGQRLVAPDDGWRRRPDMDPGATSRARASIVARTRFIEDLVVDQAGHGLGQYVLLGAGLDTFVQRRPKVAAGLRIFEVDRPGPQAWKRQRLVELGYGVPECLRLVPVDLEAGASWWDGLLAAGFDARRPAVVASAGVAMYLSRESNAAMLRQLATLAPGSTLAMTFMLPLELVEPGERPGREATERAAAMAGTPFRSLYSPQEIMALAREAGFASVRHLAAADLALRFFDGRADGLRPSSSEELLVATTV